MSRHRDGRGAKEIIEYDILIIMMYILWILNVNLAVKIRQLCRVNPHYFCPPRAWSPSYASPPQSAKASHTSQCCIWPLNAKNHSLNCYLPLLLTTATFWYVPQIVSDESSSARVTLFWRGLRCHQFWWGQTWPILGIFHKSQSGLWGTRSL